MVPFNTVLALDHWRTTMNKLFKEMGKLSLCEREGNSKEKSRLARQPAEGEGRHFSNG